MNRSVKKILIIGAVLLGLFVGVASEASAGLWWLHPRHYAHWGWRYYTPYYASWYVPYCGVRAYWCVLSTSIWRRPPVMLIRVCDSGPTYLV